ncbi:TIGR00341 family protein [Salarchaeum sp. JOR-1]|uniref:TIGR00341 family protein n=1 Tax=Salarchaeum sp. JOR-1 TaxID=2599399 RepID=UPI0011986010|nr:TIGR00341 family protein [Salarchaeum sp. JOR-1]QDX39476.1 TIGR00341 family protein [Salarchaeum sp. JOR-1]
MRELEVPIPEGKLDAVVDVLADRDTKYTVTDTREEDEYAHLLTAVVHVEDVEDVLEELRDIGIEKESVVLLSETDTVRSESLEDRTQKTSLRKEATRIPREELLDSAKGMVGSPHYALFTTVSTIVATAGLVANLPSVVIGATVVAPLMGPAVGSSVGTALNDRGLFRFGLKRQLLGVALVLVVATITAGVIRVGIAPNIHLRSVFTITRITNPGVLALVIALGAGVAGALSITTGLSEALVGVMVALAVVPPGAVAGIAFVYGAVPVAVSALVLALVNVIAINLASLATFWLKGYRPEHWTDQRDARKQTIKRAGILVCCVLVLTSFLVVSTIDAQQTRTFHDEVNRVLAESGVNVTEIEYEYDRDLVRRTPTVVTVHIAERPANPDALREQIDDATVGDVRVTFIVEKTLQKQEMN